MMLVGVESYKTTGVRLHAVGPTPACYNYGMRASWLFVGVVAGTTAGFIACPAIVGGTSDAERNAWMQFWYPTAGALFGLLAGLAIDLAPVTELRWLRFSLRRLLLWLIPVAAICSWIGSCGLDDL